MPVSRPAIALALLIIAAPPMATGEQVQQARPFPRADKLTDYRLLAPRFIHRDLAVFRAQSPPSAEAQLAGGHVTATLDLRSPDGRHRFRAPLTFAPPPAPASRRRKQHPDKAPRPRWWQATATADLADWPDGPIEATLRITPDPGQPDPPPITVNPLFPVRIVRAAVAAIDPATGDELRAWLDDANAHRPIWGQLPTWPNLETALAQPADPYANLRRFVLRSYPSPQLKRRQPYTLYIPDALDLARPAPLLILLHGSGGDHRNLVADHAAGQRFEQHPMLIANAGAFHSQEYRHMALRDVEQVLEDVAAKYPVDRRRIYLQGISLGGRGTLEIAALRPDTFAALSAQGVYGVQAAFFDPLATTRLDPRTARLVARHDIRTHLPSLRNTPTEIIFGYHDTATPALHARAVAACLRLAGCPVQERGFDTGHNISLPAYDWATTRRWMLEQQLTTDPDTVTHRVTNLRFGRNRWISVQALTDHADTGSITAQLLDDPDRLRIQSHNIAAVTLDPPRAARTLVINRHHRLPTPAYSPFTIHLTPDGTPRIRPPADPPAGHKRPGLSGPIWDLWHRPVLYVHTTGHGDTIDQRLKRSAQTSARWDMTSGPPSLPVIPDHRLTDTQRATHNLIRFVPMAPTDPPHAASEPERDTTAAMAGATVGGDTVGQTPNIRIALRPSPHAADRYQLTIEIGTDRPFSLHELGPADAGLHVDWLDLHAGTDDHGRPGRTRVLRSGCFGPDWTGGTVIPGDNRIRQYDLIHMHRPRD